MFRTLLTAIALVSICGVVQAAQAARPASSTRSATKPAAPVGPVNINTASAAELDALPGIGAKTAALIIEYRQKNGPFKKVEDVREARASVSKSMHGRPHLTGFDPSTILPSIIDGTHEYLV